MHPVQNKPNPLYLQRWEEIAKYKLNHQVIVDRIKSSEATFFTELHQSFDDWSSTSPRSLETLQRLIPVLKAAFNASRLHEQPLRVILERLLEKGDEGQILLFLDELQKNNLLPLILLPMHLQSAYKKNLVQVVLKMIGEKPGRFLNHGNFENGQTQLHLACKYNMPEVVVKLCELHIADKEKQDALGNTALHYACESGNINTIQYIGDCSDVSKMVNCQNQKKQTPLHLIIGTQTSSSGRLLLNIYQSNPFIEDDKGNNPFQYACQQGDIEAADTCYQAMRTSDVTKAKASLSQGLILACQGGHFAIVQLLVDEFFADVNHDQCSALKAALTNKRDKIAYYLIQNPQINIDVRKESIYVGQQEINTFLKIACESGADDSVVCEIFNKITLTQRDLYCACVFKKTRLIAFDQQKISWDDVNRIMYDMPFKDYLKSIGIELPSSLQTLLHLAGALNDVKLAKYLLENKQAAVDVQNSYKETPLFSACANGSLELVQILLEAKANINAQDDIGPYTPLSHASANNHRPIVEFLVSKGADIELGGDYKPLHKALRNNAFSCAFYLILKKALLPNISSETAVYFIRYTCKEEKNASDEEKQMVVEAILAKSFLNFRKEENHLHEMLCDIAKDGNYLVLKTLLLHRYMTATFIEEQLNKADQEGNTPLHYACESQSNLSVLLMINHGAEIDKPNHLGKTAIDLMIQWNLRPVLQWLWVEGELDPSKIHNSELKLSLLCQDATGTEDLVSSLIEEMLEDHDLSLPPYKDQRTYLHIACHYGNEDVAQILLINGVNLTSQDSFGELPLHLALENNLESIAGEMICRLKGHPCLNHADRQGRTPLHVACRKNARLAIQLIESGVNVNLLNATGRTPLHEAFDAQMEDVALALLKHGAIPDIADIQGYKPIVLALENGFGKIAYQMAQQSNDFELGQTKTKTRRCSLFKLACEKENWPLAFLLFTKGKGPYYLYQPLCSEFNYRAYRKGDQAIKGKINVEHIRNIELKSTVLHKALLKSDGALIASLITSFMETLHTCQRSKYGDKKELESMYKRDHRNRYPIHIACERGMVKEFESLLRAMVGDDISGQELSEELADELVTSAAKGRAKNVLNYLFPPMTVIEKHTKFYSRLKKNFEEARTFLELDNCNLSKTLSNSDEQKNHLSIHCEHGNVAYLQKQMLEVCNDKQLSAIAERLIGKYPELFLEVMYSRNRSKDLSYFNSISNRLLDDIYSISETIANGHFLMVPLLFALGLKEKIVSNEGLMPCWRSPHILNQLAMFQSWGVDLMQPNENGDPLHYACRYPHNANVVNHLLSKGLDVNQKNSYDSTPLHIACDNGATEELVNALLKAGADLKAKDKYGRTPLHIACDSQNYLLTKLILQTCIKRKEWDLLKISGGYSKNWADLEFMCQEPYAQKIQIGERVFLSHALVLIGRSSHFRHGFEAIGEEITMSSIHVAEDMPTEFFDKILLFFHTGVLEIDNERWLGFFKEVEFFDDKDLDLACREWLHDNYESLGDIEEAVKFFVTLGEAWEEELHLLLDRQKELRSPTKAPRAKKASTSKRKAAQLQTF